MRRDQDRRNRHKKNSEWYILRTEKYSSAKNRGKEQ